MRTRISFIILMALLFTSCHRNSRNTEYVVSYIPCEDTEEYGYVDSKGHFTPAHYQDNLTPIINGYGVINGTLYKVDNIISDTTPIVRNIEDYGVMNNGLIPLCRKNERIFIADVEGKEIFRLVEYNNKEVIACFSYSDSKLRVLLDDNSYIYIDKCGKQLFDTNYRWATDFKNGRAVVQTIYQNENSYTLIDKTGATVFSFNCDDKEDIVVSQDLELLCAKENDRVTIYDFDGKRICTCPAKVQSIYAFGFDGFIYADEDDEFGLMTYQGETLIRAKYEQLVPHGRNYLACTDDEDILLLDKNGKILKELDGEEIYDFRYQGFEYPTIIESTNDDFVLLDEKGRIVKDGIEEFWGPEGFSDLHYVESHYIPENEILSTIMELCRDGAGLSDKYGAFFRPQFHCLPKDITFVSEHSKKSLEGWATMGKVLNKGINYKFTYFTYFDRSIIIPGETSLNAGAWLHRVILKLDMTYKEDNKEFIKKCVREFKSKGCQEYYRRGGDYILYSIDKSLLYIIFLDKGNNRSFVQIEQNTKSGKDYWKEQFEIYNAK